MIAKQRANSSDYFGREGSEFKSFGVCLKWVFVDQSSIWRTGLSWSVFFVLAIGVPLVSHFLLACSDCDANHSRPYHVVSQLSLSLFSVLAFVSLSIWTHRYGLRKFLFLDRLYESSEKVRHGYKQHFQVNPNLTRMYRRSSRLSQSEEPCWLEITPNIVIFY